MEERFKFMQEFQADEFGFAEPCRRFGVSRKTGYKWVERNQCDGLDGLRDQSRAPIHHPNGVLQEVSDAVIGMRQQHPHWEK